MSSILVNDVFEELSEENKRLLNELMFTNRCLNVLMRFKTFVDFISDKLKNILDSNEWTKCKELCKEVEDIKEEKERLSKIISKDLNIDISAQKLQSNYNKVSNNSPKGKNKCATKKTKNIRKSVFISKSFEQKPQIDGTNNEKNLNNDKIKEELEEEVNQTSNGKTSGKRCVSDPKLFRNSRNNVNKFFDSIGRRKDRRKTNLRPKGQQLLGRRRGCGHEGCQFQCFTAQQLNDHMNSHNGVQPYECSSCGKRFTGKQNLSEHFRIRHKLSDRILICEFCNKEFKTQMSFRCHQKRNHLMEKPFECSHQNCNFKTINKSSLNSHILSHTTERRYKCSFEGCHKTCKTVYMLKQHESIHNPNRYVRCQEEGCDQMVDPIRMRKHLHDVHSGNIYNCEWPGCDFTTKKTQNLRMHSYVHSTECKFTCHWPQCAKTFKKKIYLDRHLRIHNNDKKYGCSWPGCSYRCTDSSNLIKHKRIHTKQ